MHLINGELLTAIYSFERLAERTYLQSSKHICIHFLFAGNVYVQRANAVSINPEFQTPVFSRNARIKMSPEFARTIIVFQSQPPCALCKETTWKC